MTKTTEKTIIEIPFSGWYYSSHEQELDSQIESIVENEHEKLLEENPDLTADELELKKQEIHDSVYDCAKWDVIKENYNKLYVESFNSVMKESFNMDFGLEYESMTSPKYYNFESDRLFVYIPSKVLQIAYRHYKKLSDNGTDSTFSERVKERFTSRDGFISFYSNSAAEWFEKPLADWDHNEAGTLFEAILTALEERNPLNNSETLEGAVFYDVLENGQVYDIVSEGIDWTEQESKLADILDDIREERGDFENGNPYNMPILMRCPATLPLFPL